MDSHTHTHTHPHPTTQGKIKEPGILSLSEDKRVCMYEYFCLCGSDFIYVIMEKSTMGRDRHRVIAT